MSYTIVNVLRDVITGKVKFASREVRSSRKQECDNCEVRNTVTNVCTACGCWLPAKRFLEKSTCPMELW